MRAILDRAQRERNESEVEIPYVDKLSSEEYQQCLYYFF